MAIDGFRTFEVPGVASDTPSTPSGMREELLLLSWLIVLLRSREDGQASFDWAYEWTDDVQNGEIHELATSNLAADQVMSSLQSGIGDVAAAITQQIATRPSDSSRGSSKRASIIFSTGPLCRASEGAKDEVSLTFPTIVQETQLTISTREWSVLEYVLTVTSCISV